MLSSWYLTSFHTKITPYWSLLHSVWRSFISGQFIIRQWRLLFLQYDFMCKQSTPGNVSPGAGFLPTEGPTLVPAEYKMFFRSCRVLPDEKPVKTQGKPAITLASSCSTQIWAIALWPYCGLHLELPFLRVFWEWQVGECGHCTAHVQGFMRPSQPGPQLGWHPSVMGTLL